MQGKNPFNQKGSPAPLVTPQILFIQLLPLLPALTLVLLLMHRFTIEFDREADGRYIAEIPDLPGVLVYGPTKEKAIAQCETLALRVLADRLES